MQVDLEGEARIAEEGPGDLGHFEATFSVGGDVLVTIRQYGAVLSSGVLDFAGDIHDMGQYNQDSDSGSDWTGTWLVEEQVHGTAQIARPVTGAALIDVGGDLASGSSIQFRGCLDSGTYDFLCVNVQGGYFGSITTSFCTGTTVNVVEPCP